MAETYKDAAAAMKSTTVTFKVSVLRCKKTGRVLFLEAGKDFVDTLLSFLLLPIGTIIHMLSDTGSPCQAMHQIHMSCCTRSTLNYVLVQNDFQ
jgi:hypothetical protein